MAFLNLYLDSNESTFDYSFPESFLNKNYKITLVKLNGNLVIDKKININLSNNKFYYSINGINSNTNNFVTEEHTIDIPTGIYEFNNLISKINTFIKSDGSQFENQNFFNAKLENNKVVFEIKKAYSIDFNKPNSIASVLGFKNKVLKSGKHISENNFYLTNNNIYVWCNLVNDSYINNNKINSIFHFKIDDEEIVINEEPINLIYHKVTNNLNKIIIKLVDMNNKLIEFDNINLMIDLNIKEII